MLEPNTVNNVQEQTVFKGFQRHERPVGIRNRVLVLPSVICSQIVAERIVEKVPGTVCAPHDHGCGQIGADNEQTERTLIGNALNPNVTGVLVVGLGCEHLQSREIMCKLDQASLPVREVAIQDVGSVKATVDAGVEAAKKIGSSTSGTKTGANLGDLTVGVICSDLQQSSISVAEPLVGSFVKNVVEAGGRALVASSGRVRTHSDEVRKRTIDKDVVETFDTVIRQGERLPSISTRIRQKAADYEFSNLTRAWGNEPIQDILQYGEVATHDSGLALVHTPPQFAEAATALAAGGAQLLIHVTGEGVPTGHSIIPVMKVTGNESTYHSLKVDIDVYATETSVEEFHENVINVLNGGHTCAERHGISDFAITRIGPSM